ncbi:hypothetical protein G6F46_011188 [Rhizopus delemar]|uniref:Endonuclease/exonuclease/phosphatase domain-containing protein n=2 Tax=Rhizopus TaxID=4842 RepID=A0A9P7CJT9_9FUNG|nr:hypothetical protein G6F55_004997 [Rhizopus delemar]KAG1535931.1 hypothetical protein G6F51_011252 [Rhizopus arrhizus]KAG1490296.1 hypothetical protein G6F54_010830 [Rhizopus delemar]KAG1501896.1 hypothetical protein G6F53_010980 [Rhizopus delemar]KAG1519631.1 hypothetical protein G6F52_008432 [Rhizopus delemar]
MYNFKNLSPYGLAIAACSPFLPTINCQTTLIPSNSRIILPKISHPQNFYVSFHELVAYAPVTGKDRREFFDPVLDALTSVSDINPYRIIILGDFNYSYYRLNLSTQTSLK